MPDSLLRLARSESRPSARLAQCTVPLRALTRKDPAAQDWDGDTQEACDKAGDTESLSSGTSSLLAEEVLPTPTVPSHQSHISYICI